MTIERLRAPPTPATCHRLHTKQVHRLIARCSSFGYEDVQAALPSLTLAQVRSAVRNLIKAGHVIRRAPGLFRARGAV